jgi:NAD(P)-dependent dehydrogenase (short-subunit alcohol dehydrogenase family)
VVSGVGTDAKAGGAICSAAGRCRDSATGLLPMTELPPATGVPNASLLGRPSRHIESFQEKSFEQPVVLITGALTGIGRATALAFAKEGAGVVVSGRRDDAGEALAVELRAIGAEAEFIRADVRHENDVRNLVDNTVARFGRLDVAVNNAGTEGKPGPVTEQTAESYAATFDTNVLGVLLSMKHELLVMQAQGSGSIVNLSSTMGHRGAPGASLYAASKHAAKG